MKKKDIEKKGESTSNILDKILQSLGEALTGVASSKKEEVALSIGHIFQRLRGGYFLRTVYDEWNKFREKGKIKDSYQYTEQHQACLGELLDALDNDAPDKIRFDLLKKILLVSATGEKNDSESLLPLQYMKIARNLSSGEIVTLFTVYKMFKNKFQNDTNLMSATSWMDAVAQESGLCFPELVESHEQKLMEKYLISDRLHADRSGVRADRNFRLTQLGVDFCAFVESYEE